MSKEPKKYSTCEAEKANALFRGDAHWMGGDGAYSIDLGGDRILWLFGDSFINAEGAATRDGSEMVRNSVGIQKGRDPETGTIEYVWRTGADGKPASFFGKDDENAWLWPGHGVLLDEGLLLFMMRIEPTDIDPGMEALGFQTAGWDAVYISNPEEAPSAWNIEWLDHPSDNPGVVVGGSSVMKDGDHVYAFGVDDKAEGRPLFAVRWETGKLNDKSLDNMEWWCGLQGGWQEKGRPAPLFDDAQVEMTIHRDAATGEYLCIQTEGFGETPISFRTASRVEGPWSQPESLHAPPASGHEGQIHYAAKSHPAMSGDDGSLLLTYVTNCLNVDDLLKYPDVYYPRFVKVEKPKRENGRGRGPT